MIVARLVPQATRDPVLMVVLFACLLLGTPRADALPVGSGLKPTLARTVVVSLVSGTVMVKARGARRFASLARAQAIAVGSTIDATHGKVMLVSAGAAPGRVQFGVFDGGAFAITQVRSGLTELRLVSMRSVMNVCGRPASTSARRPLSAHIINLLHGNARGMFRTMGRYASATVRGTEWDTIDRCEGTLTVARKGTVETTFGIQRFNLGPRQSAIAFCKPPHPAGGSTFMYCIAVKSNVVQQGIYGFGVSIRTSAETFQVCIRRAPAAEKCAKDLISLGPPDASGDKSASLACPQSELGPPGDYTARFVVAGQQLGVPLPFTIGAVHLAGQCASVFLGRGR